MPIALAPIYQQMRVVRLACDQKDASRLAALGLTKDAEVTVLSSEHGAVVVLVMGSRLALDHNIASKIFVA